MSVNFNCCMFKERVMKRLNSMIMVLFIIILCAINGGCLTQKYARQNQYLLNIPSAQKYWRNEQNAPKSGKTEVLVENITAKVPYDQLHFIYRISEAQYLTDYYNSFFVAPTEQLYPALVNYCKMSRKFTPITAASSGEQKIKLHLEIEALYADYRNKSNPQAVVSVHLILMQGSGDGQGNILLDKTISSSQPLHVKDTENLIAAWSKGVTDVLTRVVQELNDVEL